MQWLLWPQFGMLTPKCTDEIAINCKRNNDTHAANLHSFVPIDLL